MMSFCVTYFHKCISKASVSQRLLYVLWRSLHVHKGALQCHCVLPPEQWTGRCCHPVNIHRLHHQQSIHLHGSRSIILEISLRSNLCLAATRLTYTVSQGGVAVRLCQQESDYVSVAVLACAHKCSGALVILEIDVCSLFQEGLDHAHPTVAHC